MEKSEEVSGKCGYRQGSVDMIFFTSPLLTGRGGEVSTPGESVLRQGARQTLKLPHHFICSTS